MTISCYKYLYICNKHPKYITYLLNNLTYNIIPSNSQINEKNITQTQIHTYNKTTNNSYSKTRIKKMHNIQDFDNL